MAAAPLRLGVLVSGGGTTLQNLLDREADGSLAATVAVVVTSSAGAGAVARAETAGRPCVVVPHRGRPIEETSAAITAALEEHAVDLAVMGGFLKRWLFPETWARRVMNIHPALIPAFCGRGMFGGRVHEAVVAAGVRVTGCTVHYADHEYDHGPIIVQKTCAVRFEDTPEDVRKRVAALEFAAYPEAVNLHAAGRLSVEDGRVRVLPPG